MNYGPASKYYDLFGQKEDIDFYKCLALEHGNRALELGVGTGRVAIELAKSGVTVWGIDNSEYMIAVAKRKIQKESPTVQKKIRLILGDMRDFRLKQKFPFTYLASSTFEHLLTIEDQTKCVRSIYDVLEANGTLAFDISQADIEKPTSSSWWIDRATISPNKEVVRTVMSRRNPETNVVSVNLFFDVYSRGKLKERYYEYGEARLSTGEEIEKILQDAGLEQISTFGSFNKSPYDKNSQRMIFVATKS